MKSMSKAIVWGQDNCQYCEMAVKLLKSRDCEVEERKLGNGWTKKDLIEMVPNARSVPQIFVDNRYIGGYMELVEQLR